ncbi:palmitoyltransferase swf1 [Yamadazyma tenuis]|nr:palmitoyltransferase swf1 [Yamadazyma tenuis]
MAQVIPPRQLAHSIKIDRDHKITGCLMILCVIFDMVVAVFTGLQFRYIYLGITTNELDKWGEIEYLVQISSLYKRNGEYLELVDNQLINMQNTQVFPFYNDAVKVSSVEEIDNIYDQGFKRNFHEKFFPQYMG